jgi:hypothetical protein
VVLGDGPFALKAMDFFIQAGIAVRLFVPRSSGVDQALKILFGKSYKTCGTYNS